MKTTIEKENEQLKEYVKFLETQLQELIKLYSDSIIALKKDVQNLKK